MKSSRLPCEVRCERRVRPGRTGGQQEVNNSKKEKKRRREKPHSCRVHRTMSLVTCVTSATLNLLRDLYNTDDVEVRAQSHSFLSFRYERDSDLPEERRWRTEPALALLQSLLITCCVVLVTSLSAEQTEDTAPSHTELLLYQVQWSTWRSQFESECVLNPQTPSHDDAALESSRCHLLTLGVAMILILSTFFNFNHSISWSRRPPGGSTENDIKSKVLPSDGQCLGQAGSSPFLFLCLHQL